MQNNNKIKVDLTFSWEFNKRDWNEFKRFQDQIAGEIKDKTNFNHLDMFYHLNNIHDAMLSDLSVKALQESQIMSDSYKNINIDKLGKNLRRVGNDLFLPNPEKIDMGQADTLRKMLDKMHFELIEARTKVEVLEEQLMAVNCAISAIEEAQKSQIIVPDQKYVSK